MDTMSTIRPVTQQQQLRHVSLTVGLTAPAQARTEVRAAILAWDLPVDESVAALLISELVTNAIRHEAGPTIVLDVSRACGRLRVDVHDTSDDLPTPMEVPADGEAGRGLMLVATLSDEWGFYRTPAGKAVYFTLDFPASRS
jgi:anti-sigma regulatory factor (Ser/Thr protein kinase)